tara:strand:+ start:2724 stop:2855 length:132 start_codon:yes stop_codon:yes gene_type:complete
MKRAGAAVESGVLPGFRPTWRDPMRQDQSKKEAVVTLRPWMEP